MNRLHHPGPWPASDYLVLNDSASHHAVRVLRLRAGNTVELFDGLGQRCIAHIMTADPHGMRVQLGTVYAAATESPLRIGLAQALPVGDKMDWIIEKAIELGVGIIQPLMSAKSLVKLDERRTAQRMSHWQRIAIAACMQSGRDNLPTIHEPRHLLTWLAQPPTWPNLPAPTSPKPEGAPLRLLLAPQTAANLHTLPPATDRPSDVWLLVGPEGGWTPQEHALACTAGWAPLTLGPRVLRTETAGLAALAALQTRWGDYV